MRSSDAFPSRFLKCADLKGRAHQFIMGEVNSEVLGGEDKLVLYFQNYKKGLVLNKTNFDAIEEVYGDSDDWVDQPIVLYPDKTQFQGKRVDCVRARAPDGNAPPKKAAPAPKAPTPKADGGEEISFDIPDDELEKMMRENEQRGDDTEV
jgi:hypothetical protein